VIELPGHEAMFVAAEYDADRSFVYTTKTRTNVTGESVPGWPACKDTDTAACASWAASGECARNAGFMLKSCAESCGRCAGLSGPLVAVQALAGLGGTAARHIQIEGPAGSVTRTLLFVANYKAPAGEGVAVYEWGDGMNTGASSNSRMGRWYFVGHVDAPGAGEMAHCTLSRMGDSAEEHLLIFSSWYAHGSFDTASFVYALHLPANGSTPTFVKQQELPTHGSHDAECFTRDGTTYLLLANGRLDSGRRDVPTLLYRYERGAAAFVELQRLPSVGAHDIELVMTPASLMDESATLLAVIANNAIWSEAHNAESCDGTQVDVWRWDDSLLRFVWFEALPELRGCTTFARSWRAHGSGGSARILLAVAVERTRSGEFDAQVEVFEWHPVIT